MERIEAQARAEAEETARRGVGQGAPDEDQPGILDDLVREAGLGEEAAKAVVVAIAKGRFGTSRSSY